LTIDWLVLIHSKGEESVGKLEQLAKPNKEVADATFNKNTTR
jgi:hypothetical protein